MFDVTKRQKLLLFLVGKLYFYGQSHERLQLKEGRERSSLARVEASSKGDDIQVPKSNKATSCFHNFETR